MDNSPSYFGIFLRNATGYRVEGNTLSGHPAGGPGIVVKNSGAAYNEIYRNKTKPFPLGLLLGVQSIGRNRNAAATTGLKILCNNLLGTWDGYEISVMQDAINSGSDGMARLQYLPAGLANLYDYSAGNRFNYTTAPTAGYNYPNYFIGPNTNTVTDFQYGCNGIGAPEVPVNRNFTNAIHTQANTCPVHNDGAPPATFPFQLFVTMLSAIETQITSIETKPGRTYSDTALLDGLLTAHAQLISRAVSQYQVRKDTDTVNYIDSIALVYAKVTKGYQYKLYQASAYRECSRWGDAFAVLDNIADQYPLNDEERAEVNNTLTLYQALRWLEGPGATWDNLPEQFLDNILQCGASDRTQAGAVARALLAQYEGVIYTPEFISPTPQYMPAGKTVAAKPEWHMYPNPATDRLWIEGPAAKALLVLSDVTGREVMRRILDDNKALIVIIHLPAGVDSAILSTASGVVQTHKIVKR